MEKKIYVNEKAKAYLRKVFACSNVMVWKALNFKSDSDLARKMRHTALNQLNGKPSWPAEDVETIHDAGGFMKQRFANGVQLIVNKATGLVTLLEEGSTNPVKGWKNPTITELEKIQRLAAQLGGAVDKVGVVGR